MDAAIAIHTATLVKVRTLHIQAGGGVADSACADLRRNNPSPGVC